VKNQAASIKLLGSIFAIVFTLGVALRAAQADEIFWYKDIDKASDAAVKNNKIMMVDFWADWCAACKVMDADVYPDQEVISSINQNVVGVRIQFDMQQELARKYGIPALPFIMFTNSYGTKLFYHRGVLEKESLLEVLKALPKDISEINRLDRGLQEDKNNLNNLLAMGAELKRNGFYETSSDFYNRALKQNELKKDPGRRELAMFEVGRNALQLKNGKDAAEAFEKCLKEFPKSPNRAVFLLGAGQGYALDEKNDKAKKNLDAVISEFPQSDSAATAKELLSKL
jgi:thioredoxin-related protein